MADMNQLTGKYKYINHLKGKYDGYYSGER